jgi:protein O-mannosyl-transferase
MNFDFFPNLLKSRIRNYKLLIPILIVVSTLLAYFPVCKNNFINWDDDAYVYDNSDIQSLKPENLKTLFTKNYVSEYVPLTMVSFAIDYQIGGLNPKVYIFTNLILHILNSLLVFGLILLILKSINNSKYIFFQEGTKPFLIAGITAFLFAIHPINVESVAWVSERKNVLYVFFYLLALISYIKYLKDGKYKFYSFSLILFLCSLLSKGLAVSLPLSLVAIDYLLERKLFSLKVMIEKAPFFLISLFFGVVTILTQEKVISGIPNSFFDHIALVSYGFVSYLVKLILPVNLSVFYSFPHETNLVHWFCLVLLLAIIPILIIYRKHLFQTRFPLFAICFYLANIVFLIQLIPFGDILMADRFIYLSSIGFFLLAAILISKLTWKFSTIFVLLAVSMLLYGLRTFERTKVWNNNIDFWNILIEQNNTIPHAWNNRGNAKVNSGDKTGAINDYGKAIQLDPNYYVALYNRGVIKSEQRDFDGALNDINKVIKMMPSYMDVYAFRGKILYSLGKPNDALSDFSKAININPENAKIYFLRGNIKRETGDYKGALSDFNIAIKKMPGFMEAYIFRGITFYYLGNPDKALNDLNAAIQKNPGYVDAYYNRGKLKYLLNDFGGALADLTQAVKIDPAYVNAYMIRAKARMKMTDFTGSLSDCEAILKFDKNNLNANIIKATVNYKAGYYYKAIDVINSIFPKRPDAGILYYIRGISLVKSGKTIEGNTDLEIAKKLGFKASENELTANVSGH